LGKEAGILFGGDKGLDRRKHSVTSGGVKFNIFCFGLVREHDVYDVF
jgi:hypothetical protein